MKNFNIIGHAKIWLAISGVLLSLSLFMLGIFGLNFGIDFKGGSLLELRIADISVEALRETVAGTGKEAVVQAGEGDLYFVRMAKISTEAEHQAVLGIITAAHPGAVENRFDSVDPTIGNELKRKASLAVAALLALIGVYIAWAFRKVSEPVESWKYGVVTAVAALHDVLIPIGVFAVLGKLLGYQIDTAFVAAMLTILGYSINDTIVVFDRTRENLQRFRHAGFTFSEIVNRSVMETMGRSINTTLTTLLPLTAIFLVGGESTRPFVLALIIGIVSGAYSSIFVASPLLVLWDKWSSRK